MEPLPDDLVELELPDDLEDVGGSNMSSGQPYDYAPSGGMSAGQPANINVPPEEPGFASQALNVAQGMGKAQLRDLFEVPAANPMEAAYDKFHDPAGLRLGRVVPDALKVPAGRALQINPVIVGEVGESVFETPQGQKAGLAFQRGVEDSVGARAVGAVFGQQARLNASDVAGGIIQGAASVLPSAIPVVGGINIAGQFASKIPLIGRWSPALAGFIAGALETEGQMLVTGMLGAEEGNRLATLEALLAPPQTKEEWLLKVGLPLVGGLGAGLQARNLAKPKAAKSSVVSGKSLADEYVGGQSPREFVDFMQKKGTVPEAQFSGREFDAIPKTAGSALDPESVPSAAAATGNRVVAIVSKQHAQELADELEAKVAAGVPPPPPPPTLELSLNSSKKTPTVAQRVAVVEAPDAKKGVAAVTEWSDGSTEIQNIDSAADAAKFRKKLDRGTTRPEVLVSTRAQDILSKEPDGDIHDTLMLTDKERAGGKTTNHSVENRDTVLVWEGGNNSDRIHEIPYLAKLSDPRVQAQAAMKNNIAAIRTKGGVAFVRILGKDGPDLLAQQLPREHGLPTVDGELVRIPKDQPSLALLEQGEWQSYFEGGRIPERVSRLNMVPANRISQFQVTDAAANPVPAKVLKFEKPVGAKTTPQRSLGEGEILPSSLLMDLDDAAPAGVPPPFAFRDEGGGGGGLPPRPPGGGKPPGGGGPPEPPPEFPPGPVNPRQLPDSVLNAVRALRDLNLNDPQSMNTWRKAGRVLVGPHLRGPLDLRTHLMMLKNAEGMTALGERWLQAINDATPDLGGIRKTRLDFHKDTVEVGQGKMSVDEFVRKYPEAKLAKPLYEDAQRQSIADEAWLINENMINPKAETLADTPQYLTKMALSYKMKGKKAVKFAKSLEGGKVWDDAIKGVIADHQERGSIIGPNEADSYLRHLLGGEDPIGTWNGAAGAGNSKARKDLPPWLSKVIGQDLAGELAMAHRIGIQKSAIARGTVFKEMAKRPDWVNAEALDPSWQKMPNSRWLYHDLAGKYVHPHIYDSIVPDKEWGTLNAKYHNISKQPNGIYQAFKRLSGLIKGNEIANPATIFNSFMGNWVHMALAGVSPAEFPRYGQHMVTAAKALSAFGKNPLGDGQAQWIREARRVGFDAEGFGSADVYRGEISNLQKTFLRAVADANGGTSGWDPLLRGFEAIAKAPGNFTQKFGAVLDLTDRVHKIAAGYTLAEQAMRRAGRGERGFAGMAQEDAMRWAARRVNSAFPMPDRSGLWPKYASDAAGSVNPYSMFMTEYIRTHLTTPGRIAEDPRIGISLAAWGTVLAGMYGIYGAVNPVDKKLIEEEQKTRTQRAGTYEPATIPLAFTAQNGRPILADATPMFEALKYLSGDPTLSVAERVTGNAVINLTDRGLTGGIVQDAMGTVDPRWERHERKRRLWDTGAGAALDYLLMDSGLVPKLPGKLYRQWASTQPVPLNPYSPMQQQPGEISLMRSVGLPVLPQVLPTSKPLGMKVQQGQMKKDVRERVLEPDRFSRPGPFSGIGKDTGEDLQRIIQERTRQK